MRDRRGANRPRYTYILYIRLYSLLRKLEIKIFTNFNLMFSVHPEKIIIVGMNVNKNVDMDVNKYVDMDMNKYVDMNVNKNVDMNVDKTVDMDVNEKKGP